MKTKNILCLGNAVLDQIFSVERLPSKPGKHFASSFMEMGGGPAATASVAIARLGQQATLWSRIGDDPAGPFMAVLRLYWPKAEALTGKWRQPPLEVVK